MGRNNNRNSSILNIGGNSSNNNSNQYQYNPNLLFRPNSLWDPDSLLSVPSRQPPQQGHKCRDGKTPLDRFNNRRCRNPDTKIKYPYMRQKLKNRLSSLSIDNTDGYLKWVWPYPFEVPVCIVNAQTAQTILQLLAHVRILYLSVGIPAPPVIKPIKGGFAVSALMSLLRRLAAGNR